MCGKYFNEHQQHSEITSSCQTQQHGQTQQILGILRNKKKTVSRFPTRPVFFQYLGTHR
jgi:hypothetical protein